MLDELRAGLAPARSGIELTRTEYAQGVGPDGRVAAPTEYAAARADVRRASDAVAAVREDLRAFAPSRAAALEESIDALAAAVDRRASVGEVRVRSRAAARALTAAVEPDSR